MSKDFIIFGFSHFFGDIFDCINSVGGRLKAIVLNVPETPIPGRQTLRERLDRLSYPVDVLDIEKFRPRGPRFERYVIGFSMKRMVPLLCLLQNKFSVGVYFDPLIHTRSVIQSGADLDEGVVIDAAAIVGPWARIGKHVILNRGSSVGHDCEVGAYSFLSPSATLCSHVKIGENVLVGANAVVLPDVHVGDDAVIAACAVVRENVPKGVMVAGVPATIKRGPVKA